MPATGRHRLARRATRPAVGPRAGPADPPAWVEVQGAAASESVHGDDVDQQEWVVEARPQGTPAILQTPDG